MAAGARVEAGAAPLPAQLAAAGGGRGRLARLLRELQATAPRVNPALAARLAATARGSHRAGWSLRRCAALLLEHLFWICEDPADEAMILSHLGPDPSAIDAAGLRRRIARNARVHAGLRGPGTAPEALADFLHLAARDSRLTLARWLFTSDEVAGRIAGQVRGSRAVIQPIPEAPEVAAEAALALAALPEWERRIARALACAPRAFWAPLEPAAPEGDLVAFPAGTVVLTVNPPGSDLEIEIKRTGRPSPRPLAVVWERNGQRVPSPHRLDGGSTWDLLRFEAASSARLSAVWRALHAAEAPIARTLAVKAAYALPDGGREVPVLDYFVQEAARNPGEEGAMARVVRAFCDEQDGEAPDLRGGMALASQFLLHAAPAQSVILGTSAHRLDKLAVALADPRSLADDPEEARRILADLLDEILGLFEPPEAPGPEDSAAWLEAVFARPENRRRADACHRAAAERLGSLWGTFLAVGARSYGESLVGRNVGLKAVFRSGEWSVDLISMDHDNLRIAGPDDREVEPAAILYPNIKDELALFGGPYKEGRIRGSLELLDDIYRADEAGRAGARDGFFAAARAAFLRSVAALEPGGLAAGLFAPAYLDSLRRWRRAVTGLLTGHPEADLPPAWTAPMEKHAAFLRRHAAVWIGEE